MVSSFFILSSIMYSIYFDIDPVVVTLQIICAFLIVKSEFSKHMLKMACAECSENMRKETQIKKIKELNPFKWDRE